MDQLKYDPFRSTAGKTGREERNLSGRFFILSATEREKKRKVLLRVQLNARKKTKTYNYNMSGRMELRRAGSTVAPEFGHIKFKLERERH